MNRIQISYNDIMSNFNKALKISIDELNRKGKRRKKINSLFSLN